MKVFQKRHQISEFMKCTQITRQNEALGVSFSEKIDLEASKVKNRERAKKIKFQYFLK